MAIVLAVPRLFDLVVARLAALGVTCSSTFGWREPDKQGPAAPRMVWVPGNDSNGNLGEVRAARSPGRDLERPLATLGELVTVYVEGIDTTDLENERKQYQATRVLLDAVFAALYRNAHGAFAVLEWAWLTEKKVRRHGASIRMILEVEAMLPDVARGAVATDLGAENTPALSVDGSPASDVVDDFSPDVIPAP